MHVCNLSGIESFQSEVLSPVSTKEPLSGIELMTQASTVKCHAPAKYLQSHLIFVFETFFLMTLIFLLFLSCTVSFAVYFYGSTEPTSIPTRRDTVLHIHPQIVPTCFKRDNFWSTCSKRPVMRIRFRILFVTWIRILPFVLMWIRSGS
jgi:hypothetical protein